MQYVLMVGGYNHTLGVGFKVKALCFNAQLYFQNKELETYCALVEMWYAVKLYSIDDSASGIGTKDTMLTRSLREPGGPCTKSAWRFQNLVWNGLRVSCWHTSLQQISFIDHT